MKAALVTSFKDIAGKGDPCHIGERERAYRFTTVDQLVEDFIAAMAAARRQT